MLLLPPCVCCSVLEPGRSLTLAEKGGGGAEVVVGAEGFMVLATMNPGGDFGKKELSPALSNRFTQVGRLQAVSQVCYSDAVQQNTYVSYKVYKMCVSHNADLGTCHH